MEMTEGNNVEVNSSVGALYTPGPNAIDVSHEKDEGVLKEILKEGVGTELPLTGDTVWVHYVGTLAEDGSKFDSSRDREEKFKFTLGKGEVIKAWDQGVATMKKGEICRLTCRSSYAYGETGSPPKIPPYACLVFEIELFEWTGEDLSLKKDGGIIRRILQSGEGHITPNDGALVDVKICGRVNGKVFDERDVKFSLGEGTEQDIPEGLERAIEKFKKDERSKVKLTPKHCFGSGGNPKLGIPADTDVEYEVHLKDFGNAKEKWNMNPEEKLDQAKLFKEKGTAYFTQEKYRLAAKQYKKIVDFLTTDSGLDEEKKNEQKSVVLAGHLNLSMCHLKLKDYLTARDHANKALELDNTNVKAYFRRGQALLNIGEADEALKSFKECLKYDANNKAAKAQLQECNKIIKKQKEKEKQLYSGMFEKFAQTDAKKLAASRSNRDVMAGNLGEWEMGENPDEEFTGISPKEQQMLDDCLMMI